LQGFRIGLFWVAYSLMGVSLEGFDFEWRLGKGSESWFLYTTIL